MAQIGDMSRLEHGASDARAFASPLCTYRCKTSFFFACTGPQIWAEIG
jgi:hypothetical protein